MPGATLHTSASRVTIGTVCPYMHSQPMRSSEHAHHSVIEVTDDQDRTTRHGRDLPVAQREVAPFPDDIVAACRHGSKHLHCSAALTGRRCVNLAEAEAKRPHSAHRQRACPTARRRP